MTRAQLEHVIRAACSIADVDELIIVGSQSILGQFPDAPPELLVSMEVDLWPRHHRERAAIIEGSIGELSTRHETCVDSGQEALKPRESSAGRGEPGIRERGRRG